MAQPPTMRDVAREAQVSLKTVSRVVNREAGVRADTAERVREAIHALGFRPNALASALRRQRSGTLGLVIEDVSNPFYGAVTRAVEEAAERRGLLVMAVSSNEDARREQQLVLALCDRRVDGLVVVPASRDHRYLRDELSSTPAVFVDRPASGIEADCVLIDNVGGARTATEHLLAQGHRRVALVGDPETVFTARERLRGFRDAHAARGLEPDPRLIRLGSREAAQAEAVVRELLASAEPPTAIVSANNRNTVGALRALADGGPRPALVGFDDFELADLLPVPVTVVGFDAAELGREAAALLLARMDGADDPPRRVVVPTSLVARGSGEVAP